MPPDITKVVAADGRPHRRPKLLAVGQFVPLNATWRLMPRKFHRLCRNEFLSLFVTAGPGPRGRALVHALMLRRPAGFMIEAAIVEVSGEVAERLWGPNWGLGPNVPNGCNRRLELL